MAGMRCRRPYLGAEAGSTFGLLFSPAKTGRAVTIQQLDFFRLTDRSSLVYASVWQRLNYATNSVHFHDLRTGLGSFGRALGWAESRPISGRCRSGQIRFRQVICAGRTNISSIPLWISILVWPLPILLSSPYSHFYYVELAIVATEAFFCVFQNEGM